MPLGLRSMLQLEEWVKRISEAQASAGEQAAGAKNPSLGSWTEGGTLEGTT